MQDARCIPSSIAFGPPQEKAFSTSHFVVSRNEKIDMMIRWFTLPETNSKSTWKWMIGIRLFPFGAKDPFSGANDYHIIFQVDYIYVKILFIIFGVTWLNLKVYTFVTAARSIYSQFYRRAYVTVGTYLQLDAIGLLQCIEFTHCIPCLVCITRFKR